MTEEHEKSPGIFWHQPIITRAQRQQRNKHRSIVIWFTGLSASGKSTLAHAVENELHVLGARTIVLDGDNVRHGLCGDLGFTKEDRSENMRRIGQVSKLFLEAGVIVLTAFISPFAVQRSCVRLMIDNPEDFVEIYCKCPIEVCENRDQKGLYRRARSGKLTDFTGISSPYEPPKNPDITVNTARMTVKESVSEIIKLLEARNLFF